MIMYLLFGDDGDQRRGVVVSVHASKDGCTINQERLYAIQAQANTIAAAYTERLRSIAHIMPWEMQSRERQIIAGEGLKMERENQARIAMDMEELDPHEELRFSFLSRNEWTFYIVTRELQD